MSELEQYKDSLIELAKIFKVTKLEDGTTYVKIQGDVAIETTGSLIIYSKGGNLVLSHKFTHINPTVQDEGVYLDNMKIPSTEGYLRKVFGDDKIVTPAFKEFLKNTFPELVENHKDQ